MAKKDVCVFCGKELSVFSSSLIGCGKTNQITCRDCVKKLTEISGVERCRLALDSGRAIDSDRIQGLLEEQERQERARPCCLRCRARMRVGDQIEVDISPIANPITDILNGHYLPLVPAYCDQCGKVEFFLPEHIKRRQTEGKTWEDGKNACSNGL